MTFIEFVFIISLPQAVLLIVFRAPIARFYLPMERFWGFRGSLQDAERSLLWVGVMGFVFDATVLLLAWRGLIAL